MANAERVHNLDVWSPTRHIADSFLFSTDFRDDPRKLYRDLQNQLSGHSKIISLNRERHPIKTYMLMARGNNSLLLDLASRGLANSPAWKSDERNIQEGRSRTPLRWGFETPDDIAENLNQGYEYLVAQRFEGVLGYLKMKKTNFDGICVNVLDMVRVFPQVLNGEKTPLVATWLVNQSRVDSMEKGTQGVVLRTKLPWMTDALGLMNFVQVGTPLENMYFWENKK